MTLEQEKAQKEADIKISNSEVLALQKEFDAISCTVKQLETQKCEAQKRLDELDDKVSGFFLVIKASSSCYMLGSDVAVCICHNHNFTCDLCKA